VKKVDAQLKPIAKEIELEPFGLATGMDRSRPVMLFREKDGESILPVWLSPVDAGIALTQHNVQAFAMSPHDVTLSLLKTLGVGVESCRFTEIKGHQQYVEIQFTGSKKLKEMKFRADHAISFCLQARARFFCTRDYLEQCREVDADLMQSEKAMGPRMDARKNGHTYLN
jgi:bifunctional DNase/RNase